MNVLLGSGGAPGVINGALPSGSNEFSTDWQLNSDGTGHTGDGFGGATNFNWVSPTNATIAAGYQVKVDVVSGTMSSGTTGSWLDLSTTRTWAKTGSGTVTFTVSFREKLSTAVRSTQTVSMSVP